MSSSFHKPARSLTPLYCLHQASYFFAIAGIGAFAVTYLLGKGFSSAQIGLLLALNNILSCMLQPILGSYVDRRSNALLPRFILVCLITTLLSLTLLELASLPLMLSAVLFVLGSLAFSLTMPLSNSLCAHFAQQAYRIDYGMGAGIGSLSFSVASLVMGFIIARMGAGYMMALSLLFVALQAVLILRYPKIQPGERAVSAQDSAPAQSLSLIGFCRRYRLFMLTLLGVMCLSACHSMCENFMIQLFERIGGNSENVGVALFFACITSAPFLMLFEKVQHKTGVSILMRMAGCFYIAKAVMMVFASSIMSVYLIELLQTFTYAFLYPSLYYFARRRIAPADMVKGQAMASTLYTMGTALGNSLGGMAIDLFGLSAMFALAAFIAASGTLLINLTVSRQDG